ncbi:flavodoxin family protein [Clostridioides sp. ES-S-0006-03]|uniref:flavodoxin family protein n=1 Tax=Clostridioides sp. ES-S-0006-03 TaxID=2770775 RepID=UPI001D0C0E84|nr:flavodoxin family protein [Clostridioides sp. ES-S-0006-03]
MKVCILMGSPKKNGNTASILEPFIEELENYNANLEMLRLYDYQIEPCIACKKCQENLSSFGCCRQDDVHKIFKKVLMCDLIILATPIYSWYCTSPMKALLDRLVYGMNKYYGDEKGPALWSGKSVALITTCGYRPEKGADIWEDGIKRYCKHSQLKYIGMLVERDLGKPNFMDTEKEEHSRQFAKQIYDILENSFKADNC